ncbi:hypothetical protein EYR41_009680 [Orbilia oligospora]|uniref:Thymocyte nuclear protein 1 n=1 Tax=Orbilia oligospora TaxID=2813651 RepID=A0A7C8KD02_ORBOL|nr:hypothetical protein TWF751_006156 [Orbilia oligospora]TGJ65734.1 hypothetical protein EYR41_009680 [Orbilia oligospora]
MLFLPRLASFRISYIHRPHQKRPIGFRAGLTCTTVMAPPSSAPSASASGGRRKRARTQTEDPAHDSQTTTTTPPTRRSQRTKLTNTSVPGETNSIPAKKEEVEEEEYSKVTNKKAPRSRAKPKPVKLEDELDDAGPSSSATSASKKAVKQEDTHQAQETRGLWLMKSEPDVFSYEDLCKHDGPAGWDGVRNHVAKNHLRSMKVGDRAFFYHSNCKEPGIVGVMEITRDASIDESQFDPQAKYYDPKATTSKPRWYLVHCSPIRKLGRQITLAELRTHSGGVLKEMALFRQTRLSVSPVSPAEFQFILDLENKPEGKDTD